MKEMEGQVGLFDKKTNFYILMSCKTPEQFMRLYEEHFGCGCMQRIAKNGGSIGIVWQKQCLLPE